MAHEWEGSQNRNRLESEGYLEKEGSESPPSWFRKSNNQPSSRGLLTADEAPIGTPDLNIAGTGPVRIAEMLGCEAFDPEDGAHAAALEVENFIIDDTTEIGSWNASVSIDGYAENRKIHSALTADLGLRAIGLAMILNKKRVFCRVVTR